MFRRRSRAIRLGDADELDALLATGVPVLLDLWQTGCAPCRVMDGLVDELAAEFENTAHVVKVDVRRHPDLAHRFKVRATPTLILLTAREKAGRPVVTQRWRASGPVTKDRLRQVLVSNGARPAGR